MDVNLMKINSLYQFLFDGFFDGKQVKYDKYHHLWNLFVHWTMNLVFVLHLVLFITDNELLKNELVYLKFSEGFGSRYLNLGKFRRPISLII